MLRRALVFPLVATLTALLHSGITAAAPPAGAPGGLDPAFGGGDGLVAVDPTPQADTPAALAVQPDGKIVVAATVGWMGVPTDADTGAFRFHPDGTPDTTFGQRGQVIVDRSGRQDMVSALAVQPDGKIVVAGDMHATPATVRRR